VVGRPASRGLRSLPPRLELIRCAVTSIEVTGGEQRLRTCAVERHALALEERSLVPGEPEPGEPLDDGAYRFLRRSLPIRVLDAEEEAPAMVTREQIAEQRRPDAPDVQRPGGT